MADEITAPSEGAKRCMIYSGPNQEVQDPPVVVEPKEE